MAEHSNNDEPNLGSIITIGDRATFTGSCSWTDRTLTHDAEWYPRKTMSAEERLRYYASQLPLTEIGSTYYAPPAQQQARLWAERTPEGFRFDVKAYSLLTGHRGGTIGRSSRGSERGCRTYRIAVEFRSPRWLVEQRDRERTLSLLEEHGLVFACVDAPAVSGLPRLFAVTNPELFMVRLHGRSDSTWPDTSRSAADRFRYRYSNEELEELARPIAEQATAAGETHLLMNNCYRDYSVRNAAELRDLLARYAGG